MKKFFVIQLALFLIFSLHLNGEKNFYVSSANLAKIEQIYGSAAREKIEDWDSVIQSARNESVLNQLQMVNDFFNKIPYVTDMAHWKKKDYWATPLEFMATNGGDCEDYAIAKYFTLLELGIKKENLYLAVVEVKSRRQNHMILLYSENKNESPLVLDNLSSVVIPFSKRVDLKPKYAFNEIDSYYISNENFKEKVTLNWGKEDKWKNLLNRVYNLNE